MYILYNFVLKFSLFFQIFQQCRPIIWCWNHFFEQPYIKQKFSIAVRIFSLFVKICIRFRRLLAKICVKRSGDPKSELNLSWVTKSLPLFKGQIITNWPEISLKFQTLIHFRGKKNQKSSKSQNFQKFHYPVQFQKNSPTYER